MRDLPEHTNQDEFAALSASAFGAIVAIYVTSGPYTMIGVAISITLLLVTYSFAGQIERSIFRSIAFGSVVATIAIPAVGYAIEALVLGHWDTTPRRPDAPSMVPELWIIAIWLIAAVVTSLIDIWRNR